VQIVERSALGVRAAIYRLAHRDHALEFELFPMIHIGAQSFYDAVRARLNECDLVLFEGVSSVRARILATAYTLVAKRKRLALVCQRDALPRAAIQSKLVHADVSAPEFADYWSRIPLRWRLFFYVAAPLRGAYDYLTASRESIARRCGTDDLASRDDVLDDDADLEAFRDAIMTRRDGRLLACVLRCHDESRSESKRIGVLYGAGHIPAVVRLLQDRLGYRVEQADWVTVFEL
jgi:hypothetical protein